ncbi:bifunctional DNA primase/polymerase [Desulfovibrio sp. JC022]|nr:bifunctional DNA primase/polymerase [Desulfovibrio sp. JC022]
MDLININKLGVAEAALQYAAAGIPVFPCVGKRPCVSGGFKNATTDTNQISRWWQQFPQANIGSPTGANSFVLDIDPPHGIYSL